MHGLSPVADGSGAECQVFNQAHHPHPVLGRYIIHAPEIFVYVAAQLRITQILLGGSRNHQSSGNILGQSGNLIGEPGYILFTDIGQQQIN